MTQLPFNFSRGTQGPQSLWSGFGDSGLQDIGRAPSQLSSSGPDLSFALEAVRLATRRLTSSLDSCTDISPIIQPVLDLLSDAPKRLGLAAADDFQAFYGTLVVKFAESYLDVREEKGKDNKTRNTGAEVESFQKAAGIEKGSAWCAAFVFACHGRAAELLGGRTSAPRTGAASAVWYQSAGNLRFSVKDVVKGSTIPRAGDLFVFEQVLDTAGKVSKETSKAEKDAASRRDARLAVARKDGLKGDELAARQAAIEEEYAKAIGRAKGDSVKRLRGMTEGHKLGNNLSQDSGSWFPSHTGIVKSFDPQGGRLVTIEGNTSDGNYGSREGDGVFQRSDRMEKNGKGDRKYPQLYGFVRPKFHFV